MGLAWLDWTGLDWTFEFQWKSSTKKLNTFLWTSLPLLCHYSSSDSKMQMVHSMHTRSLSAYFNPKKTGRFFASYARIIAEGNGRRIHSYIIVARVNKLRTSDTPSYNFDDKLQTCVATIQEKNYFFLSFFIFRMRNEKESARENHPISRAREQISNSSSACDDKCKRENYSLNTIVHQDTQQNMSNRLLE